MAAMMPGEYELSKYTDEFHIIYTQHAVLTSSLSRRRAIFESGSRKLKLEKKGSHSSPSHRSCDRLHFDHHETDGYVAKR